MYKWMHTYSFCFFSPSHSHSSSFDILTYIAALPTSHYSTTLHRHIHTEARSLGDMSMQAWGLTLISTWTDVTCYQLTAVVTAAKIDAPASLPHSFHPNLLSVAVLCCSCFLPWALPSRGWVCCACYITSVDSLTLPYATRHDSI